MLRQTAAWNGMHKFAQQRACIVLTNATAGQQGHQRVGLCIVAETLLGPHDALPDECQSHHTKHQQRASAHPAADTNQMSR
jgi:hypothetical protein